MDQVLVECAFLLLVPSEEGNLPMARAASDRFTELCDFRKRRRFTKKAIVDS
jgi:hypothetical protein